MFTWVAEGEIGELLLLLLLWRASREDVRVGVVLPLLLFGDVRASTIAANMVLVGNLYLYL